MSGGNGQHTRQEVAMETNLYKVVKVFRISKRRQVIDKNLTREEAMRLVNSYPDSNRSMVVFFKQ